MYENKCSDGPRIQSVANAAFQTPCGEGNPERLPAPKYLNRIYNQQLAAKLLILHDVIPQRPIPDITGTIQNLVLKIDSGTYAVSPDGEDTQIHEDDSDVQHLLKILQDNLKVTPLYSIWCTANLYSRLHSVGGN